MKSIPNTISFTSANFVAKQLHYHMTQGWGEGEKATADYYSPLETFAERFEALLLEIKGLSFQAVELWSAHLDWRWKSEKHALLARDLLQKHQMTVPAIGGWISTIEELEWACVTAKTVGAKILSCGGEALVREPAKGISLLKKHGIKFGLENHPEKNPYELLQNLRKRGGDSAPEVFGVTLDTGWFGTQGYNAAQAILELKDFILDIHLKDVREPGQHRTCKYGEGCVPIKECVQTLKKIGYRGPVAVEHEPESHDPSQDCRENLSMLKKWLS